ncbi:peptidase M28-like protein [Flavobacterium glaciei]|uniref:Peptidase M28-like protein n=2 Tax=Flavobacterium glaciei TaxID=386300 RepID=A0A562PXL0_9FLAO|nr:M28 family peptidase [Flavobacterium glaciei]RDI56587.1 peptidase M28-like protein [Flavobacterium glaciei]TWI49157.1 peptidase M28-like protein [Flavobacterium glaciei]
MKKDYSSIFAGLFILGILGLIYFSMMPNWTSDKEGSLSEFSTKRALNQVEAISKKPHYVGSNEHEVVADYLVKELTKLGLETSIQQGYTLSDWGNLVQSKNILARIKGSNSSKALLLLSHYDSAPHSYSKGASDAGSGVATILESVRAFLYNKTPHKNDIVILFSDAEELGLNGAALFVTQHQWAKEIGLVLNFEARGSSGPSYMLMETNKGNAGLVKEFASANATFPVSNSLMYSIYKMLPNDTDLTVFREQGNIQGYNFAFIDDHYNYHTAQDDIQHLNKNTLEHQGTYLMPLLNYFSNTDLNTTQASEDYVYFTIPYTFISYPFSWVLTMVIIALALFIFLLFIGRAKRILSLREIIKGFVPFLGSIISTGLISFFGWKALLILYPQYNDLLNGFTYNGHAYIAAFVLLALAISMLFYHLLSERKVTINHYVAPLFIWIIINGALAFSLQGAGFLIIPIYFGLIIFGVFIVTQKSNKTLNLFLSIPALIIIAPFIQMFPIGLGLKVLFGSAILTVLTFGLLLPVFGAFAKKGIWSLVFFVLSIGFFAKAHYESGYGYGKAKSNSLLYVYDADTDQARWATYDKNLDLWTKSYLGENPKEATALNETPLFSKYNSGFTYAAEAPKKGILKPSIAFLEDRIVGNQRFLKIKISPNRNVNRYDIFANEKMAIHNFRANGVTTFGQKNSLYKRKGKKILSYYVVGNAPLEMQFSVNSATVFDMELMESSFDLMTNPLFQITKRENWMMPTPFVLNDAVVIRQKIKPSQVIDVPIVQNTTVERSQKTIIRIENDSSEVK